MHELNSNYYLLQITFLKHAHMENVPPQGKVTKSDLRDHHQWAPASDTTLPSCSMAIFSPSSSLHVSPHPSHPALWNNLQKNQWESHILVKGVLEAPQDVGDPLRQWGETAPVWGLAVGV